MDRKTLRVSRIPRVTRNPTPSCCHRILVAERARAGPDPSLPQFRSGVPWKPPPAR
jgi:hypothetical protein